LPVPCSFVPPYLLRRLVGTTVVGRASTLGQRTLELDRVLRSRREDPPPAPARRAAASEGADPSAVSRIVHTANNTENLPGVVARRDGDPATGDPAVDEAFTSWLEA
jgi:hypothetical protein